MIIPANEAIKLQAAKKEQYKNTVFEKRLAELEECFNKVVSNCNRNDTYVGIPEYRNYEKWNDGPVAEDNEMAELVKRIQAAGYYVTAERNMFAVNNHLYKAHFEHPKPKKPWRLFG